MDAKVYIGNLSHDATDNELRELFETHGTVNEVSIIRDRETDHSRGFAFVTMETKQSMNSAIKALNDFEFMGRNLTVNEARPRQNRFGGDKSSHKFDGRGNRRGKRGGY